MLIIFPPLCKPCEPPAALAYLQAALSENHIPCTVADLNLECVHHILSRNTEENDTWSRRALKHRDHHISALRSHELYRNQDRYRRAVADINRLLERAGKSHNIQLNLANYQDPQLSPTSSQDLRAAATTFDTNIFYDFFAPRLDELLGTDDGPVGFSLNYLSQALVTFSMIGYLKAAHPERTIILGGGLVTTWLSSPHWDNPFSDLVDHFIGGRGENKLLHLLGKDCPERDYTPDYSSLSNLPYLSPGFILPYAGSFGCFWKKCSFCPEKSENNPYQSISIEQTLSDLDILTSSNHPTIIHFLDNALSSATLRALAEKPPAAPWYGFARITRQLMDLEFCRDLKKSGCLMLKLGLESGDQAVLDGMNKGIDLELASKVLSNLHSAGIYTYVYLLFGTPQEDEAAARTTMSFVEKNSAHISYLNLAIFNLPRNSPETGALSISDFSEGDLSIYSNFVHPDGWNRSEVRRFLDTVFKRSPAIAAILRRDPPFFTSNHAPFLTL